ncbi:MAG: bifunctional precorrin-2 dehydrogenase/sirohydrochlorin ferrochelatase [Chlamydiae bacterium]|nr:bifunctional precorrin-2 dehydrogenase/sirohydrochlorin ferrochelatase [Chlamydiota bacterium]MBI3266350.1 bifunctional precorrin-2 dehydrogenase/sirohydrochlorin ferrochelatase [Chlamydiota bacterium]
MYYPIFLDLKGKDCVIFGGGEIAYRKTKSLIDCGARVSVYAPEAISEIEVLAHDGRIIFEKKQYEPDDLVGAFLVIASTNQGDVNAAISREAQERGLLVNVVDDPEFCNFIAPSILRRGKLVIAVSTEGTSPAMAKKIREDLERNFGPEYEIFLEVMDASRKKIQERLPDEAARKAFFTDLIHSDYLERTRSGWTRERLREAIEKKLEHFVTHDI